MGGALWEQVAFDGTSQVTPRLAQYRVPRFTDVPAMDVQLIDRRDVASAGAGESPITHRARDRRGRVCGDWHQAQRAVPYAE
jgi:isoquinoline 1-oxidoreductase